MNPFYVFQRPPLTTQIWIARYAGDTPIHYGRGALGDIEVVGPEGPVDAKDAEPYVVALSAGQLAFRIVGHLVQGAALQAPRADIAPCVSRIWPITPAATWPPAESVDDDGLKLLVLSAAG